MSGRIRHSYTGWVAAGAYLAAWALGALPMRYAVQRHVLFLPSGSVCAALLGSLYLLQLLSVLLLRDGGQAAAKKRVIWHIHAAALIVGTLWPVLFFALHAWLSAFFWLAVLWILLLLLFLRQWEISPGAALLGLPMLFGNSLMLGLSLGAWLTGR